jgi:capsular polysaccharide biosynthesis protein/tetratricopeptide (TPR) repeat protein
MTPEHDRSIGTAEQLARLSATGEWDGAVALGLHHLGGDQEGPELFMGIGTLLLERQMIDTAEAYLRQGCIRWPDDVWLPWHYAKLATRHRDFDVAASRWQDLIARHPESPLGLCGLAELHRNTGREETAARLYADAVVRYPSYVWAAAGRADTPAFRHDWTEAAKRWAVIRDDFPEFLRAHEQLVFVLTEGGRLVEAANAARRGITNFPQAESLVIASARIEQLAQGRGSYDVPVTAAPILDRSPPPVRCIGLLTTDTGKSEAIRLLAEAYGFPKISLVGEAVAEFLENILQIDCLTNGITMNLNSAVDAKGQEKTVFEASVQRREPPTHLTGRPASFPPTGGENAFSPALRVLTLPHGVLCNFAESSIVFSADGKSIVKDYSSKYSRLVHFYDIDLSALISNATYIAGSAIVLPDDIRPLNFSHWLADWLPRLAFLGSRARRREYYVLTTPLIAPFQLETLLMCGFTRDRIIEVKNFETIRARELLVTSDMRHPPHPAFKAAPWAVSYLQSTIGQRSLLAHRSALSTFPKKLYISRADARGRRVSNEDELFAMLEKLGYVKIVLSTLSLSEQVALFVGATHVVGVHGAGFAHLVFMTEPANVIEIFPSTHGTPAFYALTAGLENRYASYLVNDVVENIDTHILSDFDVIIDVADFERRCADLL